MVELFVESKQHVEQPRRVAGFGLERNKEVETPDPRKRSEAELEHARPVDPDEWRVFGEPAREFLSEGVLVTTIVGQPCGAAERKPMLVAVQLPDDLVITELRIEVRNR